jgi:hypothetical protein
MFFSQKFSYWCSSEADIRRSPHDAEAEESQKEMALEADATRSPNTRFESYSMHEVLTAKSYQEKKLMCCLMSSPTPGRRV